MPCGNLALHVSKWWPSVNGFPDLLWLEHIFRDNVSGDIASPIWERRQCKIEFSIIKNISSPNYPIPHLRHCTKKPRRADSYGSLKRQLSWKKDITSMRQIGVYPKVVQLWMKKLLRILHCRKFIYPHNIATSMWQHT